MQKSLIIGVWVHLSNIGMKSAPDRDGHAHEWEMTDVYAAAGFLLSVAITIAAAMPAMGQTPSAAGQAGGHPELFPRVDASGVSVV